MVESSERRWTPSESALWRELHVYFRHCPQTLWHMLVPLVSKKTSDVDASWRPHWKRWQREHPEFVGISGRDYDRVVSRLKSTHRHTVRLTLTPCATPACMDTRLPSTSDVARLTYVDGRYYVSRRFEDEATWVEAMASASPDVIGHCVDVGDAYDTRSHTLGKRCFDINRRNTRVRCVLPLPWTPPSDETWRGSYCPIVFTETDPAQGDRVIWLPGDAQWPGGYLSFETTLCQLSWMKFVDEWHMSSWLHEVMPRKKKGPTPSRALCQKKDPCFSSQRPADVGPCQWYTPAWSLTMDPSQPVQAGRPRELLPRFFITHMPARCGTRLGPEAAAQVTRPLEWLGFDVNDGRF